MRNFLEYIPFVLIAAMVRALPRGRALTFGKHFGRLLLPLLTKRVAIARENLSKAFPNLSTQTIQDSLRDMYEHLGICAIEMLRLDKFTGLKDLNRFFNISGEDNIQEALKLGRGCIILTGHVGFWEAGTFFLPLLGFKTAVVAKPMRNPLVDNYIRKMRQNSGTVIINSHKGARAIMSALRENHLVCILLDQHLKGKGSVVASFFGRPAHTTTIITRMALRDQTPIIKAFTYRNPDNTYQCHFEKMFLLEGPSDEENVINQTNLLNQHIESGIRKHISQWFWIHRRWRKCCENQD
ncbi:MAG: lysophospholipid acyltransferase family protein [Deltaproteobacteria bacterium]|jgi:KDO2-lipid IV(A) lauroyltransferase|nr:lysophospholipid acyltransferase family protein [Deltaproteobacteria bacterium]MBW2477187.1 lysophospholipid acyltransferase family protein [Deltaproteobacteria bacterium]MBW2504722.1 lysophospholipid acyltransferase family protein [Deltaproteobacteria bacterium]